MDSQSHVQEINWNGAKIITAPFKEVTGNTDLEKIKSQNNYTNQVLQVMAQQMELVELDRSKRIRLEKPLIKPNEKLENFKLNDDHKLTEKITQQLATLDIKQKKQITAISETENEEMLSENDSDKLLSGKFEDKMELFKAHADFFDWWKIVRSNYVIDREKEVNASTSQSNVWKKTRDQSIDNTVYPPFEEIEINWNGAKIIAAPFKEVTGNIDLEKIKRQNNYTNQVLQVMAQQMELVELGRSKGNLTLTVYPSYMQLSYLKSTMSTLIGRDRYQL